MAAALNAWTLYGAAVVCFAVVGLVLEGPVSMMLLVGFGLLLAAFVKADW